MAHTPKITCNACKRKIRDNWEAKTRHILKYHPEVPLIRICTTMFTPMIVENLGAKFGSYIKRMVS